VTQTLEKLSYQQGAITGKMLVRECQHGMARPQVADGGGGLQIWMVAESLLDK